MKTRFEYRHQYDDKRDKEERIATAVECLDDSLTVQADAMDTDINVLMKRMGVKDGSMLPASLGVIDPSFYGDFTEVPDLRTALDRTREAMDLFNGLPADIRKRFDHSAWKLHEFVNDPENYEEAIRMGLLHRNAKPANTSTQPTGEPNAATPNPNGGPGQ